MLWLLRWCSGRWTFLVEILSSCCGHGWCRWHFLAPFNLRHSPCGFLYNHLCLSAIDTITSLVILPVMAGDCGDKIPSKSKPQSAGITSCANFENVLRVRYLQTSSFRFYCIFRKFRECSQNSSVKSRISSLCRRTTRFCQSWWSLRLLLFLLKRQLLPLCFNLITQLLQCRTS